MKRITVKRIDEFIKILESVEHTNDELTNMYKKYAVEYLKNYADRLDYMNKKSVKIEA